MTLKKRCHQSDSPSAPESHKSDSIWLFKKGRLLWDKLSAGCAEIPTSYAGERLLGWDLC